MVYVVAFLVRLLTGVEIVVEVVTASLFASEASAITCAFPDSMIAVSCFKFLIR